jgi:hypothetical protein
LILTYVPSSGRDGAGDGTPDGELTSGAASAVSEPGNPRHIMSRASGAADINLIEFP